MTSIVLASTLTLHRMSEQQRAFTVGIVGTIGILYTGGVLGDGFLNGVYLCIFGICLGLASIKKIPKLNKLLLESPV
jgi:hypothetical protein